MTPKPSKPTATTPVLSTDPAHAIIDRLRGRIRTVLRKRPTARPVLADYFARMTVLLARPRRTAR